MPSSSGRTRRHGRPTLVPYPMLFRSASGRTDAAIEEWRTAQKLNPSIPVLQANLGRVLLRMKRDVPGAAEAFRAGLAADPSNTEIYAGLGTTLGMLGRPAAEVAAALERYPDRPGMPRSEEHTS